ncbi:hypothetical protein Taro_005694 [Colocasia esculenta]|uniref:Uncharacterized protein n=1 Tax=Colocasia esculenta TaxID=4460 RepID=A0A843TQK1_COLES|nr:hypothetical protein [Colocasia esculenta]
MYRVVTFRNATYPTDTFKPRRLACATLCACSGAHLKAVQNRDKAGGRVQLRIVTSGYVAFLMIPTAASYLFMIEREVADARISWDKIAANRFTDYLNKHKTVAKKESRNFDDLLMWKGHGPLSIWRDYWDTMCDQWAMEHFLHCSRIAAENQTKMPEATLHTSGSICFGRQKRKMAPPYLNHVIEAREAERVERDDDENTSLPPSSLIVDSRCCCQLPLTTVPLPLSSFVKCFSVCDSLDLSTDGFHLSTADLGLSTSSVQTPGIGSGRTVAVDSDFLAVDIHLSECHSWIWNWRLSTDKKYVSTGPGFQNSRLLEKAVAIDRWYLSVDRYTALSTDRPCKSTGAVPEPEICFWMTSPVHSHTWLSTTPVLDSVAAPSFVQKPGHLRPDCPKLMKAGKLEKSKKQHKKFKRKAMAATWDNDEATSSESEKEQYY